MLAKQISPHIPALLVVFVLVTLFASNLPLAFQAPQEEKKADERKPPKPPGPGGQEPGGPRKKEPPPPKPPGPGGQEPGGARRTTGTLVSLDEKELKLSHTVDGKKTVSTFSLPDNAKRDKNLTSGEPVTVVYREEKGKKLVMELKRRKAIFAAPIREQKKPNKEPD